MAGVFFDTFDSYNGIGANTGLQSAWVATSTVGAAMATGRFSLGQAASITLGTNNNRCWAATLPSTYSSFSGGFAYNPASFPSGAGIQIFAVLGTNGSVYQDSIVLNSDGSLSACRGGDTTYVVLNTTSGGLISLSSWYDIGYEIVINDTTGTFNLFVNNNRVLNLTSQDTLNSGSTIDTIRIGGRGTSTTGSGSAWLYDDVFVCDNATYIGARRAKTLRASGDVAQGFTRSSGSTNYTLINEATADGDTSYVQGGLSALDRYDFDNLGLNPSSIDMVNAIAFVESTDVYARRLALNVKSGATSSDGTDFALGTSYAKLTRLMTTDPNTGSAWTASAIDALQGGPKVTQ